MSSDKAIGSQATATGPRTALAAQTRVGGFVAAIARRSLGALALAALCCAASLAAAPAAQAIGIETLFAGNCKEGTEATCGQEGGKVKDPSVAEAEAHGYRTAGGFVPLGVTAFRMKSEKLNIPGVTEGEIEVPEHFLNPITFKASEGESVRSLRTDVAPGVVTSGQSVPHCSMATFGALVKAEEGPENPAVYAPPACPPDTIIGFNSVETVTANGSGKLVDAPLIGKVYNLEPLNGWGTTYGVAIYTGKEVEVAPSVKIKLYTHTIIEGNVEWATNYHDYFEIHNIPVGLIESRLALYGDHEVVKFEEEVEPFLIAKPIFGNLTTFIRNPTSCNPPGPATENTLSAVSDIGTTAQLAYADPVGTNECEKESPFTEAMSFSLEPQSAASDAADGITTTLSAKHPSAESGKADVSDLKEASILLPPGMSMNPSAAAGLEACTPKEIGIGTRNAVTCPPRSQLGTVSLEVPTLPPGSLAGNIYLGAPESGPITGPPYTIYLDAESSRYGVKVRLKGTIAPNEATGQLRTTFAENPEAPFTSITLRFNTGPLAPLANPLSCGAAKTSVTLAPFSGVPATFLPEVAPFTVTGCSGPSAPFAAPGLAQEAQIDPATAGSFNNFTLNLARAEGQQYLSTIKTVLPPGLVGDIPDVTPCAESAANAGTCSSESKIGTVSVQAGSGADPYTFTGTVYLTEKYGGSPYGLSIVVPANAGPFALGNVITRATVAINPYTAQVEVSATLPMIVRGIPIRLRSMTFHVDRPGFYRNPTSCAALPLTSALGGTSTLPASAGGSAQLVSDIQATGCAALPFKPRFAASTQAKTSRLDGASLKVTIGQEGGGEANIAKAITVQPYLLPSRLATLQKACPEAQGAANIMGCPATSLVGHVTAVTPTLPGKMEGPAYIVSQGGRAFPNLDLVLEGDGVRVILVGNTDIHKGITTTTFAANPDVPIKSFTLELPQGPHSLLSANGSFCKKPLIMPTTLIGQNGKEVKQSTQIAVSGCLPILRRRILRRRILALAVRVPQAGQLTVAGKDLKTKTQLVRKAKIVTVRVALTRAGIAAIRNHHRTQIRVRVHFAPRIKHGAAFTSFAKVVIG